MKRTILLISTAILLVVTSCIKRETSPAYDYQHRDYFTATFDNYFTSDESGIMVFLSDLSGKVLASERIDGQTHLYINPTSGLFPVHIIETLVYKGPVVDGKSTVYLYSYLQIVPSDWIWTTFESSNQGTANLNISNIPSHTEFNVSSKFQWIHGNTLPSYLPVSLGVIPDNLYILLHTPSSGYRYKWLTDVQDNNLQVDLSSMDATLNRTIPVPATSNLSWQLSGYLPSAQHARGLYMLDYDDRIGSSADSVTLHFPGTIFNDFQFYINTMDLADIHKQWYQYNFGTIPNRIDHLAGDIQVLDSTPAHFHVQTSGTFDRLGSTWECNPIGPYRYQWTVYGPPTATTFTFPTLPADLAAEYIGLSSDSLKLNSVEIKDFSGISSYDDLIKKMFVSGDYIANIVPQYSGLIYHMNAGKKNAGMQKAGDRK
jgi:hypothetical protein